MDGHPGTFESATVKVAVATSVAEDVVCTPPISFLSAIAVIVVVPQAVPVGVARPVLLTVAIIGTDEVHVTWLEMSRVSVG